jgi:hypothetical protein
MMKVLFAAVALAVSLSVVYAAPAEDTNAARDDVNTDEALIVYKRDVDVGFPTFYHPSPGKRDINVAAPAVA